LFPAPRSFTGEDVLELQGHGGTVVLDLILHRCLALGARLAQPGEFTQRAYLNGKLDLAQAEAVADLIESSTALSARLAGQSLQGVFSQRIDELTTALTQLRVLIEATLDFPEEELDAVTMAAIQQQLHQLIAMTQRVIQDAQHGQVIRDGLTVVIAGVPNVGKSTLLNALSGMDAAIVTALPGTTRDVLKLEIQIDGLPVRIVDTAGLRDTDDLIEREGVRRAQTQLTQADLILWVIDATDPLQPMPLPHLSSHCPITRIVNKIDVLGLPPRIIETATGIEIALAAATGAGLDLLRTHLKSCAGLNTGMEGAFIARRRHLDALERGLTALEAAVLLLQQQAGMELIAEELLLAQQHLGEITGKVTSDELLGRIFSSFCIGK
jgi:tRNA modification GTPase